MNKKIINIQYNYLILPDRIEFEDGSSISYLYDAAGTKLRVVHSIAGNTTTTDYYDNAIYENGTPLPLPFYYPLTNTQSYRLPSDQQVMRHASGKFAELGQIINHTPKMSYAFGTLLYYQAKNAIRPEYEHQRKRDRRNKEGLDRNQANVAESIDTNVSGMMPNGDPAPKRDPKDGGKKTMVGMILGAIGTLSKETLDVTNPDPSQDSYEVHTKKVEKKEIYGPTIWEEYFDWKINF